ncbi:hypothetical protein K4K53_002829 [Colletotrichum sp. SAR 10_77]|nr:hypothetical protein K4K53_002829 [Colletotrichum sp. SAR 10_77]KAJ5000224.1 hypothetical protein K4K48_002956 [Colletotrichum sp. SAR 10_66]
MTMSVGEENAQKQLESVCPSGADVVTAELAKCSEAGPRQDLRLKPLNLLGSISELSISELAKRKKATVPKLLAPEQRLVLNSAEIASVKQLIRYFYNARASIQDDTFEAESLDVLLGMIYRAETLEEVDASLRKAVTRALEVATGNDPLPVSFLQFRLSAEAPELFDGVQRTRTGIDMSTPEEVVLEMAKGMDRLVYLM